MNNGEIRITAVIPAHLASVRFPRKILIDIKGLPIMEIYPWNGIDQSLKNTKYSKYIKFKSDNENWFEVRFKSPTVSHFLFCKIQDKFF